MKSHLKNQKHRQAPMPQTQEGNKKVYKLNLSDEPYEEHNICGLVWTISIQ